jgi:hypothetical protein
MGPAFAVFQAFRAANRFPLETCLLRMHEKFSRPAFDPAEKVNLTDILCFEYDRMATNGGPVRVPVISD